MVDIAGYVGREQAFVKHCLIEQYLPEWGYRVGRQWDSLVYIDGFSGPWQVSDPTCSDSSFGVASKSLRQAFLGLRDHWGKPLKVRSILVEKEEEPFKILAEFAARTSEPGFEVKAIKGEFVKQIPELTALAENTSQNPFRFVFLDPKGWNDIPMRELQPLLKDRSCEVLINLMTGHMMRFFDQEDRAESYHALYGRDDALPAIKALPVGSPERSERAVREYCRSLRRLCGFKYVSEAVILERQKERVRYFLVFATNHPRGVEVFKSAEMKAARIQDEVRQAAKARKKVSEPGLDFGTGETRFVQQLRHKYLRRAKEKAARELLRHPIGSFVPYSSLFCEAMAFPLVAPADLVGWITHELADAVELKLEEGSRSRRPEPARADCVAVCDRAVVERYLFPL